MGANGASLVKRRILLFAPSLGGGGAEMHLTRLANHLDRSRFEVAVAVVRGGGSYESQLASDVERHTLTRGTIPSSSVRMMAAIRPLRRLVEYQRPDLVFSVLNHANAAAVTALRPLRDRPRLILGEQSMPSIKHAGLRPLPVAVRWLMRRCYPMADAIVALSEGSARDVAALVPSVRDRIHVINNVGYDEGVVDAGSAALPPEITRPSGSLIVACGRLVKLKGYADLIEAVARLHPSHKVTLWIVGEGPERASLEALVARLGLGDAVKLLGFQHNPHRFMAVADVFVLASYYEGFGNVLVEAMVQGVPVVSTDCPSGPREILAGGAGLLVPVGDAAALADALVRILGDRALHERLSSAGRARAAHFSAAVIAGAYSELFAAVLDRHA